MARKKVALRYIADSTARRERFRTRSNCLMKKAGELATLCNVKACVIVYPEGESTPQVFSSHGETEGLALLNRFRSLDDDSPLVRTMDQECFLEKRVGKLQNQELKCGREREEIDTKLLLHKAMAEGNAGRSVGELANVGLKVEAALKSISDRIAKISGQPPVYHPSSPVQVSITNGMESVGAPAPTAHVASSMDTSTGAQAPTAGFNGGMHTVGAEAQPQQEDTWLDLMRTGGGDLDAPACSAFNNGASTSATVGLNGDEMMQTFNPWGGPDLGPSSSSFPPM